MTKPPNDFESELAAAKAKYMDINDFDSALRTRPDTGAIYDNKIILGWVLDTFDLAFKEGYERGKAETVQCPCCGEAFTIGPGTETYVTQTEKELTEARAEIASLKDDIANRTCGYCDFDRSLSKERDELRAEIAALDRKIVKHVDDKSELRALAARMAEVLKLFIHYGGMPPGMSRRHEAKRMLSEYEAFERENK